MVITTELQEAITTLRNQGEFAMEALHAVALSADSEEWIVHVKWVGLAEPEMTWALVPNVHQNALTRLVS